MSFREQPSWLDTVPLTPPSLRCWARSAQAPVSHPRTGSEQRSRSHRSSLRRASTPHGLAGGGHTEASVTPRDPLAPRLVIGEGSPYGLGLKSGHMLLVTQYLFPVVDADLSAPGFAGGSGNVLSGGWLGGDP